MRRVGIILLAAFALTACAGIQQLPPPLDALVIDFSKMERPDLQAALAMASAAKDAYAPSRVNCWQTALGFLPATPPAPAPLPQIKGLASLIEASAEAGEAVNAIASGSGDLSPLLVVACAPLLVRGEGLLLKAGIRVGGSMVPGVGAILK